MTNGRPYTQARYLMGTLVEIQIWGVPEDHAHEAILAAFQEMRHLHRLLSRFEPTSEVSHVNRQAASHPIEVSPELIEVLLTAQKVYRISHGAFDVTCGPWLRLWEMASHQGRMPTCTEWQVARNCVGGFHLSVDPDERTIRFDRPGVCLDLGGAGKGYAVDRAVAILQQFGVPRGLVDAGGNFEIFGFSDLPRAGIENPFDPDRLIATVDLIHPAIASSAQTHRFLKIRGTSYGHVIDPRTGWPVHARVGATILAESALLADCVSTALLVLGPRGGNLIESFPVEGLFVLSHQPTSEESTLWVSTGLRGHVAWIESSEVTV